MNIINIQTECVRRVFLINGTNDKPIYLGNLKLT